jgi:hypothetical protein
MNAPCALCAAREAGTSLVVTGGTATRTWPAEVIRGAVLRVLTVVALALAGLLLFGLLPGGRDASAVTPSPHPLPVVPAVHYLHPQGPNRALHRQREAAGG